MNRWSWFLYAGRKALSRSSWNRWAGIVVGSLALASVLVGFVLLIATLAAWSVPGSQIPERGWSWIEIAVRILIAVVLIGIGAYWMASSIWRGAVEEPGSKRSPAHQRNIALANELAPGADPLPTIPAPQGLMRGDRLTYRLKGDRADLGWFIASGIASLVSVGILTVLCWAVWLSFAAGRVDGWAVGAAVCCVPVAAWAIYRFFLKFLVFFAFGPTRLEISSYPLIPGQTARLFLRQRGQMRLHLLEVVLICEEVATYSQGTNIRTEAQRVYEQRLFRQRGIAAAEPFQCEFDVSIPADAMHSFLSESNRIQWKIIVSANVRGWPRFEHTFPITVQPPLA